MSGKWRWNTAQFAERKWWQNYLKNKDVNEYLQWKKNYWQHLLNQCLKYITINQHDAILDAGCGPAGMFMLFPEKRTVAFDPLIDTYELDLPHFKKSMYPSTKFIKSGLEDFSYPTKFNVIFCMNAINHVHDIQLSYDNLFAHAEQGAYVIITIDAHNHSFFKHLFRLLPGDILHPHQYDLSEYQQLMTNRGCEIVESIHLKHEFFFDHYMLIGKMK
jgi:2-polyprenyl-3-methyl-5-hydroxy-6-metoxy-1,4-benzoquinol methylase